MRTITKEDIFAFERSLRLDEKAQATVGKYVKTVWNLMEFLGGKPLTKEGVLSYRDHLRASHKAQTVNGALSAINAFLNFLDLREYRVKLLKIQRRAFLDERRELTEAEYKRLLAAAKSRGSKRLYLLMLTLCGTGIRISELSFITVEAARNGRAEISMKGKQRTIILQKELRRKLLAYAKEQSIDSGYIFRTRTGRPLDRSNICHDMKTLCSTAKVDPRKVFPHNLRHLFARSFYAVEKNLAHLADVLGHSRIETTRIYVAVSASTHEKILKQMHLIL